MHTWVALGTIVRGTLIDSTQPHMHGLRVGFQQGAPGSCFSIFLQWWNGCSCVVCRGIELSRNWETVWNAILGTLLSGGKRGDSWRLLLSSRVCSKSELSTLWQVGHFFEFAQWHVSSAPLMDMSLCPIDLIPGTSAYFVVSKHQPSPLCSAMIFPNKRLRYSS